MLGVSQIKDFINPKELTDGDVSSSESCGHSEASNGG
jgi:hypothetical protein